MYILLESASGTIDKADIHNIDCMGSAETEREAMSWRNQNFEYREYKYMPVKQKGANNA